MNPWRGLPKLFECDLVCYCYYLDVQWWVSLFCIRGLQCVCFLLWAVGSSIIISLVLYLLRRALLTAENKVVIKIDYLSTYSYLHIVIGSCSNDFVSFGLWGNSRWSRLSVRLSLLDELFGI
jgi:hypothetical protein